MESKKKKKTKINYKQNRSKLIDTENILMVATWEEVEGRGKKGEKIKMCKLEVTSHGHVKYSMGNLVSNIAITVQCQMLFDLSG